MEKGSSGPSEKRPPRKIAWGIAGGMILLAGLALLGTYRWQRHHYRRFQEVRPRVLYRMGLPSELGFRQIAQQYGIRTVVCLHEQTTPHLKSGWFFDLRKPSGPAEKEAAEQLGIRFLHWPIADQGPWPWPTPEHLEEFFRLMDQPENWPVLIHCWAGKHRAGTLAALFRLEYDHWPTDAVLEEMYGFGFGEPSPLQEHNLRTYVRRPRPSAPQWQALQEAFGSCLSSPPQDYDELVRAVRAALQPPAQGQEHRAVATRLEEYLRQGKPFAVCLADRLIQGPGDSWVPPALRCAEKIVFSDESGRGNPTIGPEELTAAAGLLADYGPPEIRTRLWHTFSAEMQRPDISARYQALVAGVTNRYRLSRAPYLKLLLEDRRPRPEPEADGTCYADTAVARLAAIVQEDFIGRRGRASRQDWDQAIQRAHDWLAKHPALTQMP